MKVLRIVTTYIFLFIAISNLGISPRVLEAQTVDELQLKINDHNQKIQQIEKEINSYKQQVSATAAEANTLQSAIKTLDVSGKQLSSEISLAQNNINKTELTIEQLGLQIGQLQDDVTTNTQAISETMREMNESDQTTLMETLLQSESISDVWKNIDTLESFQNKLKDRITELNKIQGFLNDKKSQNEKQKSQLQGYKSTLSDKKQLVDVNKQQKSSLLSETKNKQAEYNRLLAQKQAEEAQFQKELFDFESQLKIVIDKSKIAPAGKGVLSWPLDNVYITQYFGKTVDAARLYVSGTHNGIDLRAALNTPIKAALTGVVRGTGNTDAQPGCYSYGKWVMVEHNNGLSTLYGHMNLIKVSVGQTVATGEIIGYSGQTGYATGPHVHFTVYATQGVRIERYTNSLHCQNVDIPIADPKAYLDPMLYL